MYSQVCLVAFSKNYSFIIYNIIFFILLHMLIIHAFSANIVSVKIVILYGTIDKEVYMKCLEAMANTKKNFCMILNECIYGLKQAMRQYW